MQIKDKVLVDLTWRDPLRTFRWRGRESVNDGCTLECRFGVAAIKRLCVDVP
ncbi:hypothetical protein G3N57_36930 [Paraburkholderia sp. Se-20369]|nr:hypothetical protein [Paraburkholderia sp. Se-20369]